MNNLSIMVLKKKDSPDELVGIVELNEYTITFIETNGPGFKELMGPGTSVAYFDKPLSSGQIMRTDAAICWEGIPVINREGYLERRYGLHPMYGSSVEILPEPPKTL